MQNQMRCNLQLNLPLSFYSVRTDWQLSWPIFSNSNPISTLFAAVGVVKLIAATIDIALYLHNSTSHHEHSYSKYALADCSLIFSFMSNYDQSCVYSNSTVGAVGHCFTDVIMQDTYIAILLVSLDSTNSLTLFLTPWSTILKKVFISDTKK